MKSGKEVLKELGFKEKKCKICGSTFFTKKEEDICQDCKTYLFLEKEFPSKKLGKSEEVRKIFIEFFENADIPHAYIEPYPVVCRWREDVYLTAASIFDFQPNGGFKPWKKILVPANPLVISQPCIREVDLESVGVTGRHLASFEMMAHHCFNEGDEIIYWEDKVLEYAYRVFTEGYGFSDEDLQFIVSWWEGGGNGGQCYEVFYGGIEVATLVLMDKYWNGNEWIDLGKKIVDTGYGLERILWICSKKPSAFLALYEDLIKKIENKIGFKINYDLVKEYHLAARDVKFGDEHNYEKLIERFSERANLDKKEAEEIAYKLKYIFALSDFTRAITLLLADYAVPSNREEGYTVRLLIRRAYNFAKLLGLDDLKWIIAWQIRRWKDSWPKLFKRKEYIFDVLEKEIEKYEETLEKGRKIVEKFVKKKKKLTKEDVILLYDSYGVPPEILKREFRDVEIEFPENFEEELVKRHRVEKKEEKKEEKYDFVEKYPETKLEYYVNPYKKEDFAKILHNDGKIIILDSTIFYPEGGGQPSDIGIIENYEVYKVIKYKDRVLHFVRKISDYRGIILLDFSNTLVLEDKIYEKLKEIIKKKFGEGYLKELEDEFFAKKIIDEKYMFGDLLIEKFGKDWLYENLRKIFEEKEIKFVELIELMKELRSEKFLVYLFTKDANREFKEVAIKVLEEIHGKFIDKIVYVDKESIDNLLKVFENLAKEHRRFILIDNKLSYDRNYDLRLSVVSRKLKIFLTRIPVKFGETSIEEIRRKVNPERAYVAIDWDRRYKLMKMHTATHVLLAALRRVLGEHVWQYGAQKDPYISRFDFRHYKKLTEEEVRKIESIANEIIKENFKVNTRFENKVEAERKYGFVIYQGGVPDQEIIRIVEIEGIDVQACGGTHVKETSEIGGIKIVKRESIADGVERVYFTILENLRDILEEKEEVLRKSCEILRVDEKQLPKTIERIFSEWKDLNKENKKLKKELLKALLLANNGRVKVEFDDLGLFIQVTKELREKFEEIVIIGNHVGYVYSKNKKAKEILEKEGFRRIQGTGEEARGFR